MGASPNLPARPLQLRALRLGDGHSGESLREVVDALEMGGDIDLEPVVGDTIGGVGHQTLGLMLRCLAFERIDFALHRAHLMGRHGVLLGERHHRQTKRRLDLVVERREHGARLVADVQALFDSRLTELHEIGLDDVADRLEVVGRLHQPGKFIGRFLIESRLSDRTEVRDDLSV